MLFCNKCGKQVADGTKYCPECGTKISIDGEENNLYGKPTENVNIKSNAAGIIGIIGTLIAFAGMFMPMLEAWGQKISYYGLIHENNTKGLYIFVAIFIFAITEIFLFYAQLSGVGNVLGIVAFIVFLYSMFGYDTNGMSPSDIMKYISYGFWVMSAGLIMTGTSSLFGTGRGNR